MMVPSSRRRRSRGLLAASVAACCCATFSSTASAAKFPSLETTATIETSAGDNGADADLLQNHPQPIVVAEEHVVDDDDHGDVPTTILASALRTVHHPYASLHSDHPCAPRHVHLAPGDRSSPDEDDDRPPSSSATVSFSLPRSCSTFVNGDVKKKGDTKRNVRASIVYGLVDDKDDESGGNNGKTEKKGTIVSASDDGDSSSAIERRHRSLVRRVYSESESEGGDVRRYRATSLRYGGPTYESDDIHHVSIVDLEPGKIHWYKIEVVEVAQRQEKEAVPILVFNGFEGRDGASSHYEAVSGRRREEEALLRGHSSHDVRVGSDDDDDILVLASTPEFSFTAAPPLSLRSFTGDGDEPASAPHYPVKIAAIGDLGQTYNSTATMLNVHRETHLHPQAGGKEAEAVVPATLLLCAGDMSYADSDQTRWDSWFDLMEPVLSSVPFAVSPGNHEIECDAQTLDVFVAYENRFRMPNRVSVAAVTSPVTEDQRDVMRNRDCSTPSAFQGQYDGGNAYYAFEHGPVKIISLSSYSDTSVGSKQYDWLVDELNYIDRHQTPWVVVMMHGQFYTTFANHVDEIQTVSMKASMERLFVEHRINLVLAGHDHAYMRSKSVAYDGADPTGKSPVYIIVGEGGNREEHVRGYRRPNDPEEWVAFRDKTAYGFGTLEVTSKNSARWKWIRDVYAGDGGGDENGDEGILDDVWLENQYFLH